MAKYEKDSIPEEKRRYTGKHARGLKRPHVWYTGPDEYKHSMYQPWLMAKAQAAYRGEEWTLDFEDYYNAWNGLWDQRGRTTDGLCMTRKDYSDAWTKDNIEIITRKEHFQRQRQKRADAGYEIFGRGPDTKPRKNRYGN
jgi:hypothetical protein